MEFSKIDNKQLYRRKGYVYNRICFLNGIAVYEVFYNFSRIGFEVCKISINKHPRAERPSTMIPGDEQWGTEGFTCLTLKHAYRYVSKLHVNSYRVLKAS